MDIYWNTFHDARTLEYKMHRTLIMNRSRNVSPYRHNTSVTNTTSVFIYDGIYAGATCFDLVGHPQALQEKHSMFHLYKLIYFMFV